MKKLLFPVLMICIAVFNFHCQKELSGSLPVTVPGATDPVVTSLQGSILDENGQAAAGVTVTVGTKTVVTDSRGYFRIKNASLDKYASLVTAEKPGYFKAYRRFTATNGTNMVLIQMIRRTAAGTINASAGGAVSLTNGARIELPANAVVIAQSNAAYSGTITVYASYIDPTSNDIGRQIPGSYAGKDANNKSVIGTSYGMMAVELISASGEKLQIALGKTATVTTPIPSTILSSAPATIALSYLDETTGLWKEEGQAIKTGTNYVGEVKHFSYWNCYYSGPKVYFTAKFVSQNGQPLQYAYVGFYGVGGLYNGAYAWGWTDSLGQVSGLIPANMQLTCYMYSNCYTQIYLQNVGPFSADTDLGTLTVNSQGLTTISGKVVNCSNAPVTSGQAIVYYGWTNHYCPTDNNGNFSVVLAPCYYYQGSIDVFGEDFLAQQQGPTVSFPLATPTLNVGNISACGTANFQYINYAVDGVSHTLTGDSTYAYIYNIGGGYYPYPYYTSMYGYQGGLNIDFYFYQDNAVGTYPLVDFNLQNYNQTAAVNPIDVNITKMPAAVGEFFEGNFSGQFRDSSDLTPLHTINCTFRLRRRN